MGDKGDKTIEGAKPQGNDEELADLLDSALQDFTKKDESAGSKPDKEVKAATTKEDEGATEWSEDFITQAASQFEANFSQFLQQTDSNINMSPDDLHQKLQQISSAAQQALSTPLQVNDNTNDFAASISQAVQGLSEGAEGLQNPFSEGDLMNMFNGQDSDLMVNFMQGMMQTLLSKDAMAPCLQEYVDKYPAYIAENRDKLSPEEIERFEKQKKLMEDVLNELNSETSADSAQQKSERFSRVLELMQKVEACGQPPKELVQGDQGDFPMNFDKDKMNGDCTLM